MSDLCPVAASVNAMSLEDQAETMGGSLLFLLSSKKFSNVIFTFANRPERIQAHKFCLKARSPVFQQIFRMRKSKNVQGNEIEVTEFALPSDFNNFLRSFLELVRTGALANAEEETLIYALECDDLAVKEVQLFEIILTWGINQVGIFVDEEILRNKLKNLIPKIRYTNMAPKEFTKVVVPTGLLSAEETISVYSFLCGDDVTRSDSNIKFNTTSRKLIPQITMARSENLYSHQGGHDRGCPAQ